MAVLILYFLFLIGVSTATGALVSKFFFKKEFSYVDSIWLGMGTLSILAGIWSIFGPLDFYFSILIILLAVVAMALCPETLKMFRNIFRQFTDLGKKYKFLTITILVLTTATACLPGYVLDNDSYYIQTIKWLDTHGLVPGIANWHIFLVQQSGFHVLEAALNLDFLVIKFNDVGLFLTLVMMLWSILPSPQKESVAQKAFRNLLLLALPFLLLLGTAPSPDVPVILIHYYVIYKFLFADEKQLEENLILTGFLTALACYFKITSVFLLAFPLLLLLDWKQKNRKAVLKITVLPVIFAALFLVKNSIASGYPLFPFTFVALEVDWLVPLEIAKFYSDATEAQAYGIGVDYLNNLNLWERFLVWVQHPGMDGWLHKFIALVIFCCVIGLGAFFKKSKINVVLIVFLLFAMALFYASPQGRFFLPFFFPVAMLLWITAFSVFRKYSAAIARLGIVGGCGLLLLPGLISILTDNQRMKAVPKFTIQNLLLPSAPSRFGSAFAKAKINNINYHNPESADFFYGTYDIPLPAAQPEYLEYYQQNYQVSPEYRGSAPRDGFRAVRD